MLDYFLSYIVFNFFVVLLQIYFMGRLFHYKYNMKKTYLYAFLLLLPYLVYGLVYLYFEYFQENGTLSLVLALIGNIFMLGHRFLIINLLTDIKSKYSIVYIMIFYYVTMIRYAIEDVSMYLMQIYEIGDTSSIIILFVQRSIMTVICFILTEKMFSSIGYSSMKAVDIILFIGFFVGLLLTSITNVPLPIYIFIMLIPISLLYIILYRTTRRVEIQNIKEYEKEQTEYILHEYQLRKEELDELSKIKHDEKNHMLTFMQLYQSDPSRAKEYIKEWNKNVSYILGEKKE